MLIMSDCNNGLRAIEETWRGLGKPYRQRAGGATIEAINNLREKIGHVVFMYTPSHAGVVPNAYADGIAKAHLQSQHRIRTGQIVAKYIKSRGVIYEKRVPGQWQLKDGTTFKHTRLGAMEWIRGRSKSEYKGGQQWNQVIMSHIGKGPRLEQEDDKHTHITPEEAKAHAKRVRACMNITCG